MSPRFPGPLGDLFETSTWPALGPDRRSEALSVGSVRVAVEKAALALSLDAPAREFLLGAALLWHDHLDESHHISQGIHSADGSWLHGIMHRREPDYGNARYWFNRVGRHPAFARLATTVEQMEKPVSTGLIPGLVTGGHWWPDAFIEMCETAAGRGGSDLVVQYLQRVQQAEFSALLHHALQKSGSV